MTRALRTGCSVCQDTATSDDASAPNCRCNPATAGVPDGSGDWPGTAAAADASPTTLKEAASSAPDPIPAAASSLRRLSSRLGLGSSVVMWSVLPCRRRPVPQEGAEDYRDSMTVGG